MFTKEQIDYLYRFCEKHVVFFYELQTELVDHLANGIEEEMDKDKSLSFESALDRVYALFGIFGFATFVREKQSQVFKKVRKEFWLLVLKQFRWPAVLTFLLVVASVYTVAALSSLAGIILTCAVVLSTAGYEFYQYRISGRFFKKVGKKFLLRINVLPTGFFWVYFLFYFQIYSHQVWELTPLSSNPIWTALFSGLSVVSIIASIHLDQQIKEKLTHDYPQVFYIAR